MRIAAIGRTEHLYNSILKAKDGGHDVVLIITGKAANDYKQSPDDFQRIANNWNIDFLQTENINSPEAIALIEKTQPDIAISVNWRTLIGENVLHAFPMESSMRMRVICLDIEGMRFLIGQ